ncbi:putative disease resistance RPP13-like protein 1 [Hibiscus syriacus]|uniref:putative disease resistance RPP13-like protein 1 n=1 Tax=Hibiscus syriacus TaxID=106335 RepID=UPI00192319D6|nr:putative disease resistance RPP13-like protein 1 [Hibiscus syriacus]
MLLLLSRLPLNPSLLLPFCFFIICLFSFFLVTPTLAFIGEVALSKLLDVLLGKSIDVALKCVADHKQVYDQLKEWKSILPDIKAVLNHAEEKQIKDEGVKSWLEDLQDLAYDADDILDEFAYKQLRLKLQTTQAQASTSKVQKLLPTCCTGSDFTPSSFLFKNAMIPKMKEITARLNSLATRRSSLGLSEILPQAASFERKKPARLQPTSLVDGAVEYVGRDNEKREMIDLFRTNNSDGVCVLSMAWVCISDDFDAVKMTNTILQSIDPSSPNGNDLNLLQVKLKEKLSEKRVLLVLDDLWNESYDYWTIFRSPFGAMTKIIHALRARNFNGHLQFKLVGENIVRRCNGLPLAAKAIGSFLRTTKNLDEWERIYESEIWDLVAGDTCCKLEGNKQQMVSHRSRHSSYISNNYDTMRKFEAFDQANSLRTFLWLPSKMENLVNLHYLDIRGAGSIERMPLGIGNLANFQRLSDFVIGDGDAHRSGELNKLSNIRGDFCLSRLENVNGQDAREARLKSGITKLVLKWGEDFEKPTRKNEVEEQVLDSLIPPKKLEQLMIENFGGAKFSTWIADSSLRNLSSLELRNCKHCKSLPPIGRLPSSKVLSIGGLDEVSKIGTEFFGENQSIAFASLERLSFWSLPKWGELDACEGDEQVSMFPSFGSLSIRHCPQLVGRLPTCLQSLQSLFISECRRLVASISSFPSLRELSIKGCEELVDECSSSSPVEEVLKTVFKRSFQEKQRRNSTDLLLRQNEVWAIYDAHRHAWRLEIKKLILETDCLDVARLIIDNVRTLQGNSIVEAVRRLLQQDWEVKVQHVGRDQNKVAESLARASRGEPIGETGIESPRNFILDQLQEDITGHV